MKVLIIEDDPTDLKLVVAVLKVSGYSVCEKSSAEGVMDIISVEHPDVILLDLRLPGMDGLTLVRQLKSDASTCQIPVVAMTAFSDQYKREELRLAGCDTCIIKPINTRTLAGQLMEAVYRKPP